MTQVQGTGTAEVDVHATGGLNPGLLYASDGPRYLANVQRNSEEGRILPAMGVFERA